MTETEMLQRLESSYKQLSKERKNLVVPLDDLVKESGFVPSLSKKCESILKRAPFFELVYKKEGVQVGKHILSEMLLRDAPLEVVKIK